MSTKYYAVKKGKVPGIYHSWAECQAQTKGYSGAIFKSFTTRVEAENFIDDSTSTSRTSSTSSTSSQSENNEVKYTVYTDGSYYDNSAGGAAVVVETKSVFYAKVHKDEEQSNNRGELLGIILALQNTTGNIVIHTDSQYSINILSNGYTAKKNFDMIEQIRTLMKNRVVHYQYVPAHTGVLYNEIADQYAKLACLSDGTVKSATI